jgi:uncharacterized protein (TIGR00106 family)
MALMQITIIPLVEKRVSIASYVAELQKYLKSQKFPYQMNDMSTIIEGEAGKLFNLAKKLHQLPFAQGSKRVYTVLALDERKDKKVSLGDKVQSVQKKL